METFTIITAGSRPRNAYLLEKSIKPLKKYFNVNWIYSADSSLVEFSDVKAIPDIFISNPTDSFGNIQKNKALEIAKGWIYFLDDDNLIHPLFAETIYSLITKNPNNKAFVLGQFWKNGTNRLKGDVIEYGKIDAGSVVVHQSIVGSATWFSEKNHEIRNDFDFINFIYQRNPSAFYISNIECTYYNYLRDTEHITDKIATTMILWSEKGNYEWPKLSLPIYRKFFPDETLILVDNNKNKEELEFVKKFDPIIIESDYKKHGQGIDLSVSWCQENNIKTLVHLEPDCLISGKIWYNNLVNAIKSGMWMAGTNHGVFYPHIHPCPSAWDITQIKYTFEDHIKNIYDIINYHYWDIFDYNLIANNLKDADTNSKKFFYHHWDTGAKNWFFAHCKNKAALVESPDFKHYWGGGFKTPPNEAIQKFRKIMGLYL